MRLFSLIIFMLLISSSLFSQVKELSSEKMITVMMLINDDLNKNASKIKTLSTELELSEKLFIYQDKSKSSTLPFVLNLFVGFGIGSWVQGDAFGGFIGTVGGISGFALMSSYEYKEIGTVIFLGTYLIDLFLPFAHTSSYNRKLKSAIGLSTSKASLNIRPGIDVTQNGHAIPAISLSVGF